MKRYAMELSEAPRRFNETKKISTINKYKWNQ